MPKENRIVKIYKNLRKKYGHPQGQWKLWCKRPKTNKEREEVIIGAILTQRANWKNVELAMNNLKKARLNSLIKILANKTRLAPYIRPSGFYKQKGERLYGLAKFIVKKYGSISEMKKQPLPKLRQELLGLKGIGPETADSILLYALEKPVFVIDEYTRRLLRAKRIARSGKYEDLRNLFEKNLKKDYRLYQDFHALIVIDGKNNIININK